MPALGDLEIAVMEAIWRHGELSAKAAHADLGEARGISLNTVQSTMERLFRKRLLRRSKHGHAYRYAAAVSRDRVVAGFIRDVLGRFGGDAAASLAAFVESAGDLDDAALDRLETELRRRRQRERT